MGPLFSLKKIKKPNRRQIWKDVGWTNGHIRSLQASWMELVFFCLRLKLKLCTVYNLCPLSIYCTVRYCQWFVCNLKKQAQETKIHESKTTETASTTMLLTVMSMSFFLQRLLLIILYFCVWLEHILVFFLLLLVTRSKQCEWIPPLWWYWLLSFEELFCDLAVIWQQWQWKICS